VIQTSDTQQLVAFAVDGTKSPEARRLAENKVRAGRQDRQRAPVDWDWFGACTVGLELTTRLGRLMVARQSG